MRRIWIAVLFAAAGCGDRLSQGDRVILVDSRSGEVLVQNMEEHTPVKEGLKAYHEMTGSKATREFVNAGTRATVVLDDQEGNQYRQVKIMLSDGPFEGLAGEVSRNDLKKE